jgi:hypothetical protein
MEAGNMATNKATRSIHLAQPQPRHPRRSLNPNQNTNRNSNQRSPNHDPAELIPVKPHVYYAIAELNAGLEKAIHNLQMLQSYHLFGASGLTAMNHVLRGIRARANQQLLMVLNERETANAGHFHQASNGYGKSPALKRVA